MEEPTISIQTIDENLEEGMIISNKNVTNIKNDICNDIDLTKLNKKELCDKCKELGIKCYTSKNKSQLIEIIKNKLEGGEISNSDIEPNKNTKIDTFTKSNLIQFYNLHKSYVEGIKELSKKEGIKVRFPSIPEYISENIIKFIIHKTGDESSSWNCNTGDLYSQIEGKQECKCFTSDGPISFTPSSEWDVIYFLDARYWLNNNYILYKVNLKKNSDGWKNIPMNKNQTFDDQCKQGRRPRIGWDLLYKHIDNHCEKIYEGTFEEIIN
jgi:hypothetical protein